MQQILQFQLVEVLDGAVVAGFASERDRELDIMRVQLAASEAFEDAVASGAEHTVVFVIADDRLFVANTDDEELLNSEVLYRVMEIEATAVAVAKTLGRESAHGPSFLLVAVDSEGRRGASVAWQKRDGSVGQWFNTGSFPDEAAEALVPWQRAVGAEVDELGRMVA